MTPLITGCDKLLKILLLYQTSYTAGQKETLYCICGLSITTLLFNMNMGVENNEGPSETTPSDMGNIVWTRWP